MRAGNRVTLLLLGFSLLIARDAFRLPSAQAATSAIIAATAQSAICGNAIKEHGEECDGTSFLGATCDTLGYEGGGSIACQPACGYDPSHCLTAADRVERDIFPTGAAHTHVLSNGDGTSFTVDAPIGSFAQDMDAFLFSYLNSVLDGSFAPPSGFGTLARAYRLVMLDGDGSPISALAQPLTLAISYDDAELGDLTEAGLRPYRFGDDHLWHEIAGATVQTTSNIVSFPASQPGVYRLMAAHPVAVAGGNTGNGFPLPTPARVVFSGRAYPGSFVTLLRDGQVVDRGTAGSDGFFVVSAGDLGGGLYTFGIYAQDAFGLYSPLLPFMLQVAPRRSYAISNANPAPTITAYPAVAVSGDSVQVVGHAQPSADVTITVGAQGGRLLKTRSDAQGAYAVSLPTGGLPIGSVPLHAQSGFNGIVGPVSRVFDLALVQSVVPSIPPVPNMPPFIPGDLNRDRRVDLVDFSIAAYWYGRPGVPPSADVDGDGTVTLVDFSIMASHWTG